MGRNPGRIPYGKMQLPPTAKPLEPGALYHYWHPNRDGVERAPKDFAARLASVHRDLAVCRPPMGAPTDSHCWLMWYRVARVTHHLSPGWLLLFCWQEPNLTLLPLDDRIFANLYRISAQAFGGAVGYFESIVKKITDEKAAITQTDKDRTDAGRRDYMQFRRIKNIGRGNKFAMHHDGTVVPSRSESNWVREGAMRHMPAEHAKAIRDRALKRQRKSQAD